MMENCANMDSKREPQSRKVCQKYIQKVMLTFDIKKGHTSYLRRRSGEGGGSNTNNTKPTVNIPTANIPTVIIPTVNTPTAKTQKNNMRGIQQTDNKYPPLARHSRKRGCGYIHIYL